MAEKKAHQKLYVPRDILLDEAYALLERYYEEQSRHGRGRKGTRHRYRSYPFVKAMIDSKQKAIHRAVVLSWRHFAWRVLPLNVKFHGDHRVGSMLQGELNNQEGKAVAIYVRIKTPRFFWGTHKLLIFPFVP